MSKQYLTTHTVDNAHITDIFSVATTPKAIISASGSSTLHIHDSTDASFPLKQSISDAHKLGCHHVCTSRGGTVAASAGFGGEVKVWALDQDTGEWSLSGEITGPSAKPGEAWALALSEDGKYLASTTNDGRVNVWNVSDEGKPKIREYETGSPGSGIFGMCVDLSRDGKYTASGHQNGAVYIFNNDTGRVLYSLSGLAKPVRSVAFSPGNTRLAAAGDAGIIAIYDMKHGEHIGNLTGHSSWITAVDWSDTGEFLLSGSMDGKVKVWSIERNACVATHSETDKALWSVKWLPKTSLSIMSHANVTHLSTMSPKPPLADSPQERKPVSPASSQSSSSSTSTDPEWFASLQQRIVDEVQRELDEASESKVSNDSKASETADTGQQHQHNPPRIQFASSLVRVRALSELRWCHTLQHQLNMAPPKSGDTGKKAVPRPSKYDEYSSAHDGTYRSFLRSCKKGIKKGTESGPTIAQFMGTLLVLKDLSEENCPKLWKDFAALYPAYANILRRGALEFHAPNGAHFKVNLPGKVSTMRRHFIFSNPDYEEGMPTDNTDGTSKTSINKAQAKKPPKRPTSQAKRKQDKASTTLKSRKKSKKDKEEALDDDSEQNDTEHSDAASNKTTIEDFLSDKDEDNGRVEATKKFEKWKNMKKLPTSSGTENSSAHLLKPESAAWQKSLDLDEDIYGNDGIDGTQPSWSIAKAQELANDFEGSNGNETSDVIMPLDQDEKHTEDVNLPDSDIVDACSVDDAALDSTNFIIDPTLTEICSAIPSEPLDEFSEVAKYAGVWNDNSDLLDPTIVDKENLDSVVLDGGDSIIGLLFLDLVLP
ncbi:hypothetical protein AK830_g2252 [Neonectria ditissima]|uniref:Uncharacterized protein n=1 Tax=Neonectria ditissima TaxID=78410 RepID=A0A0N8H8D8_9HYPO|nr:hypothetical protein AK830_g2252 [Neonectria ditissima]